MKHKQTRNEKKEKQIWMFGWVMVILGFIIASAFLGTIFIIKNEENKIKLTQCQEDKTSNFSNSKEYFDNLNKNCGSSFVTTQYNQEGYFVFVNDCNSLGYCKSVYVPLENCEVLK